MSTHAIHIYDDDERHLVGIGNLHVLITERDGEWFAQGVEIDYAATGWSLEAVKQHFELGLKATVGLHINKFNSIDRLLRFAPESVWGPLKSQPAFRFDMLSEHDVSLPENLAPRFPYEVVVLAERDRQLHPANRDFAGNSCEEKTMSKQQDAMVVLEEIAQSLKESAESIAGESDYDSGRLMGYYEALSTLLSQCSVMGIAPDDLRLGAGFKPESLLNARQAA